MFRLSPNSGVPVLALFEGRRFVSSRLGGHIRAQHQLEHLFRCSPPLPWETSWFVFMTYWTVSGMSHTLELYFFEGLPFDVE